MKPRSWAGVLVFVSSYVPLAIILAILDFNISQRTYGHPVCVLAVLALAALATPTVFFVVEHIDGAFEVEITQLQDRSNELVNYTLPYIVSFIGIELGKPQSLVALIFFLG